MIGFTPLVLVVHPSVPAKTVKEFIALGKSKPGSLNFASLGPVTTQGLAATMFNQMTGIDAVQVPYKGSAPGVSDLLGGNVQYMFNALPSMLGHVKGGKLRGLGVSSARRSPEIPDLPTIEETVPGYVVTTWYSFVAPKSTPREVVELLNREITAVLRDPDVAQAAAHARPRARPDDARRAREPLQVRGGQVGHGREGREDTAGVIYARSAASTASGVSGTRRTGEPIASCSALAMAAAVGRVAGSPAP